MSETRFGSKMLDVKQPAVRREEYEDSPEYEKELEKKRRNRFLKGWLNSDQWIKQYNGKIKTQMTNQKYYYVIKNYEPEIFYEFKNLKDCKRFIEKQKFFASLSPENEEFNYEIFRKKDLEIFLNEEERKKTALLKSTGSWGW